jgi:hypothetical protein
MKSFAASVLAVVVVAVANPDIERRFVRTNGDTNRDMGISGDKSFPPGIAILLGRRCAMVFQSISGLAL